MKRQMTHERDYKKRVLLHVVLIFDSGSHGECLPLNYFGPFCKATCCRDCSQGSAVKALVSGGAEEPDIGKGVVG